LTSQRVVVTEEHNVCSNNLINNELEFTPTLGNYKKGEKMRKSLLVVLLLWIAVIVVIASCMKSTNVEQTNLHTSNINVGKVHNKV